MKTAGEKLSIGYAKKGIFPNEISGEGGEVGDEFDLRSKPQKREGEKRKQKNH